MDEWEPHDDPIKEHVERSFECFRAKKAQKAAIEAKKVAAIVKKTAKREAAAAIEAAELKVTAKDIGFFDSIMQIDL